MKVRHVPAVLRHDPMFVLKNGHRMLAHTFRGTTWRSLAGIDSARSTFARYCAIRRREREYVDWPDPLGTSRPETRSQPPAAISFGLPVNIAGLGDHRAES